MGGCAFHRRGEEFVLIENVADVNLSVVVSLRLSHDFRDSRLMRVAYYPVHPWQYGDLLRRALSVTASDQNARLGVLTMHSMNGIAHIFVGQRSDGATV